MDEVVNGLHAKHLLIDYMNAHDFKQSCCGASSADFLFLPPLGLQRPAAAAASPK